jgi:hypothetical protein
VNETVVGVGLFMRRLHGGDGILNATSIP